MYVYRHQKLGDPSMLPSRTFLGRKNVLAIIAMAGAAITSRLLRNGRFASAFVKQAWRWASMSRRCTPPQGTAI
jgi:hypothetical protein